MLLRSNLNKKYCCSTYIFFLQEGLKLLYTLLLTVFLQCTVGQKKIKHSYLFQYKLPYRNETGINHHGFLFTSVWCSKVFLRGIVYMEGLWLALIFSILTPKSFDEMVKFMSQIAWKQIFTTFLTLVGELLGVGMLMWGFQKKFFFS